ncbi:hypothetical protein GGS26DRAFT_485232 [Hypomontagnella submonticulosa]|nr:hypothetical protein GGS26DRAFT_485232 [Hypomontagnella submonticulosa]
MVCRVTAVYEHLRTLWNDFCLWSQERHNQSQNLKQRESFTTWGIYECQVGYVDPSENPKWRISTRSRLRHSRT